MIENMYFVKEKRSTYQYVIITDPFYRIKYTLSARSNFNCSIPVT